MSIEHKKEPTVSQAPEDIEALNAELMNPDTSIERLEELRAITEAVQQSRATPSAKQEEQAIDFASYPPRVLSALLLSPYATGKMKDEISRQVLGKSADQFPSDK